VTLAAETIVDLQFHAQFLDEVVGWHHAEWLRHLDRSALTQEDLTAALHQRRQAMLTHLSVDAIPSTFLAMINGQPIGSVSLIEYHLNVEPSRVWLTNLWVAPHYRRNGIGSRLLAYAENFMAKLAFDHLYLYTFDARQFYQAHAWVYQNSAKLRDYKIDILRKPLK
jgi:GNAT superfamily N-acetyltransferase